MKSFCSFLLFGDIGGYTPPKRYSYTVQERAENCGQLTDQVR